jgi:hypothetical protein
MTARQRLAIEQLGLGLVIPQTRYRAQRVAEGIRLLLADGPPGNAAGTTPHG